MVSDHHFPRTRKTPSSRPDAISTPDCDRKDRHIRLQRKSDRTGLKSLQSPTGRAATAFWENHYRTTLAQPLKRTTNRRRITSLEREWPCSEPTKTLANDWPFKGSAPRKIASWTFDLQ